MNIEICKECGLRIPVAGTHLVGVPVWRCSACGRQETLPAANAFFKFDSSGHLLDVRNWKRISAKESIEAVTTSLAHWHEDVDIKIVTSVMLILRQLGATHRLQDISFSNGLEAYNLGVLLPLAWDNPHRLEQVLSMFSQADIAYMLPYLCDLKPAKEDHNVAHARLEQQIIDYLLGDDISPDLLSRLVVLSRQSLVGMQIDDSAVSELWLILYDQDPRLSRFIGEFFQIVYDTMDTIREQINAKQTN